MERYILFKNWKTHCEDGSSPPNDVQILTISMKILVDVLKAQTGKLILEFIWKYKGY